MDNNKEPIMNWKELRIQVGHDFPEKYVDMLPESYSYSAEELSPVRLLLKLGIHGAPKFLEDCEKLGINIFDYTAPQIAVGPQKPTVRVRWDTPIHGGEMILEIFHPHIGGWICQQKCEFESGKDSYFAIAEYLAYVEGLE